MEDHQTLSTIQIVIPIFNTAKYLSRCLLSLSSQTFLVDAILVDDGSDDRTPCICDEEGLCCSRLIIVHKPNCGVSSARNTGLDIATGDYIGFVDGDDTIKSEMYATLLRNIVEEKADISICGFYNQDAATGKFEAYCKDGVQCTLSQHEQLECLLLNKLYSCSCCDKLFRRELVTDVRFDERITHYEDLLFLYQVMKKSSKAVFTSEAFYFYYANQGSAVISAFSDKKMSMIDAWEYILEDAKVNELFLYPIARQEFVRNNLMCASFAANSGYHNKVAIERMRKNVQKNLLFYLKQRVAIGYKVRAVALSIGWSAFRLLNR